MVDSNRLKGKQSPDLSMEGGLKYLSINSVS